MQAKKVNKLLVALLAISLCLTCVMGVTLAYLTAKTQTVTNVFTTAGITLDLAETTGSEYKMVPGQTIEKDPKLTVGANSEPCYLYVKVEETNNTFDTNKDYITYDVADGWTALSGVNNVYYRTVNASEEDQDFQVLAGNVVTVNADLTVEILNAVGDNKPTLAFTGYACQSAEFDDAKDAWDNTFGASQG